MKDELGERLVYRSSGICGFIKMTLRQTGHEEREMGLVGMIGTRMVFRGCLEEEMICLGECFWSLGKIEACMIVDELKEGVEKMKLALVWSQR